MEQGTISRKREIITALAVLIVIVAIVTAVTVTGKKKSNASTDTAAQTTPSTSTDSSTSTPAPSDSSSSPSTTTASFKDGSYTATGSYDSPGGEEQLTVSVTLANGTVTATSAKSGAEDPEAQEYQDDFIAAYKQQVVGKAISSISLSRVSGSSLTSQGFNDAIAQIKQQAQA